MHWQTGEVQHISRAAILSSRDSSNKLSIAGCGSGAGKDTDISLEPSTI